MGGHAGLLLQLRPAPGIPRIHHLPQTHETPQHDQAHAIQRVPKLCTNLEVFLVRKALKTASLVITLHPQAIIRA